MQNAQQGTAARKLPTRPLPTEKLSVTNARLPFLVVFDLSVAVLSYRDAIKKNLPKPERDATREKARNAALLADRLFETALKVKGSLALSVAQEARSLCDGVLNVIYTVANLIQNDDDMKKTDRVEAAIADLSEATAALMRMLDRAKEYGLVVVPADYAEQQG